MRIRFRIQVLNLWVPDSLEAVLVPAACRGEDSIHRASGFTTINNCVRNLYESVADLPLPKTVHAFV